MASISIPTEIKLNKKARILELTFDDGQKFELITAHQILIKQNWDDLQGIEQYILQQYP